jgi:hypothetical protein
MPHSMPSHLLSRVSSSTSSKRTGCSHVSITASNACLVCLTHLPRVSSTPHFPLLSRPAPTPRGWRERAYTVHAARKAHGVGAGSER